MATVGTLIGGVGLFLLGMTFLTDGLRVLAGAALKRGLAKATTTTARAVVTGLVATAVVQSSTATTLMAIGFVNAGLIGLAEAIGLLYGANVGTTLTGWMVALVGVKVNASAFALPLTGIGAMLKLFTKNRLAALGMAIAGFGLLFHGIDLLQGALAGVSLRELGGVSSDTILGRLALVGLGAVMTVVMQSSSAALAVTLAAVSTGSVELSDACALAIGQNVGTTSSAFLSVLGPVNVNARRAAVAHALFNVGTGLLALAIFRPFLDGVERAARVFDIDDAPSMLAFFHTSFNVVGVLVFAPFARKTAAFLERVIKERAFADDMPRFLDKTALSVPDAALAAVERELERMKEGVLRLVGFVVDARGVPPSDPVVDEAQRLHGSLRRLGDAIALYLEQIALEPAISPRLFALVHVLTHLVAVTDEARAFLVERIARAPVKRLDAVRGVEDALVEALHALELPRTDLIARRDEIARWQTEIDRRRSSTRDVIFAAVTTGELTPSAALALADDVNDLARLTYGLTRAAHAWTSTTVPLDDKAHSHPSEVVPSA